MKELKEDPHARSEDFPGSVSIFVRARLADVLVQWENRRLLSGLLGHSPIHALVRPLGGFGHIMAFGPGF